MIQNTSLDHEKLKIIKKYSNEVNDNIKLPISPASLADEKKVDKTNV